MVLNEAHQYAGAIKQLIDAGVLALSSGSRAFETEIDDQKRVRYWPIREISLTHTPADWTGKTKVVPIRAFCPKESQMDMDTVKAAFRSLWSEAEAEKERKAQQERERAEAERRSADALAQAIRAAVEPLQKELSELREINEAQAVRLKKLEEMPAVDTLPQQSGSAAEVRSLDDYYNNLLKK
jgi:hypothetical protein